VTSTKRLIIVMDQHYAPAVELFDPTEQIVASELALGCVGDTVTHAQPQQVTKVRA